MFKFVKKLLDSNQRQLEQLKPIVEKVNSLEKEVIKLKDDEFPAQSAALKKRLSEGETLDDLLPEAFALAREAIKRVIDERAFDVQLMAAICLHQGKIAEQKTGEGKTLSAALSAYLNALPEEGVHVVTVNDYLARRDTGWYGKALKFLGLEVGCIIHDQAFLLDPDYVQKDQVDERLRHLRPVERKQAYQADVTYGTNNEFGFDYLRDNMVVSLEKMVQRKHRFAIIDEVDFVLIDEARTPLIISSPDTEPTEKYYQASRLVSSLSPDTDYVIDEKFKTATLTEHGIKKVEKKLGVDNLYEKDFDTIHHLENSLRARTLFKKDRDYVVKDGEVIIVDEFTGRLMHGRRWSDGLHQAVEAKEGVKIKQESKTMATISFQNYFRMYEKLAGMTGTAATEAEEFKEIYDLETVVIPTNLPLVRKRLPDVVYKTRRAKFAAVVSEIEKRHQKGQPVLVGTTSIQKNRIVDKFLDKKDIPHQVLNAKNHQKEATIIADAGKIGAVTVATNLAGRGVDIVLGGAKPENPGKEQLEEWQQSHDRVIELGGLHVIGTERHESRRIDNQLRGRAGRQGDPGSSQFFVSLEDDLMRIFGGEKIASLMTAFKLPENQPLEHGMVSKAIEQAQVKVENFHFDARKRLVEYDDVMNRQREIIYGRRQKVLTDGTGDLKEKILSQMREEIDDLIVMYVPEGFEKIEVDQIVNEFCEILPLDSRSQKKLREVFEDKKGQEIADILKKTLESAYQSREEKIGPEQMRQLEKYVTLRAIDRLWVDHLDAMDSLREGISLRGYAQLDPLVEYKKEAYGAFEILLEKVDAEIIRRIFRTQIGRGPQTRMSEHIVEGRGEMALGVQTPGKKKPKVSVGEGKVVSGLKPVVSGKQKIGRNDPCWCGSGKKYKKCHYPEPPPG